MYQRIMQAITAGIPSMANRGHELPAELEQVVNELVRLLERGLSEISYRSLAEQIEHGDWPYAGSFAGEAITLIPGHEKVACTRAALAVCTGVSPPSRLGFPNVMRTVREYLIDCARISEVVVLVTDVWSPRHVEEHLRDVLAHQRQGRFVVPHLVSGRRLLRLDWS